MRYGYKNILLLINRKQKHRYISASWNGAATQNLFLEFWLPWELRSTVFLVRSLHSLKVDLVYGGVGSPMQSSRGRHSLAGLVENVPEAWSRRLSFLGNSRADARSSSRLAFPGRVGQWRRLFLRADEASWAAPATLAHPGGPPDLEGLLWIPPLCWNSSCLVQQDSLCSCIVQQDSLGAHLAA